jgi:hypothetical protein
VEAATLKAQKREQNVAIVEWANILSKNVSKTFFAIRRGKKK